MKLKNLATLRRRANWHAKKDHISQQTYGEGSTNGHLEYKGCAIGCLVAPSGLQNLRAWIKELGTYDADEGIWEFDADYGDYDDDEMVDDLGEQFGISPLLARAAEALFELQLTHGDAINFIPKFAAALNEKAQIDDDELAEVLRGALPGIDVDTWSAESPSIDWTVYRVRGHQQPRHIWELTVERGTAILLDWLNKQT